MKSEQAVLPNPCLEEEEEEEEFMMCCLDCTYLTVLPETVSEELMCC
jgi:hypothetical protein